MARVQRPRYQLSSQESFCRCGYAAFDTLSPRDLGERLAWGCPSVAQQIAAGEFTLANALATLLTTESLLFAAFALAVNLTAPSKRVRAWVVPPAWLAAFAVLGLSFVATGAGVAWHGIFVVGGWPSAFPEQVIAASIAAAIAVQPCLALGLVLGLRTED